MNPVHATYVTVCPLPLGDVLSVQIVLSHFIGEPWSLSFFMEGPPQLFSSHLAVSLPLVKREKSEEKSSVSLFSILEMINGNLRDFVDFLWQRLIHSPKPFPFFLGTHIDSISQPPLQLRVATSWRSSG